MEKNKEFLKLCQSAIDDERSMEKLLDAIENDPEFSSEFNEQIRLPVEGLVRQSFVNTEHERSKVFLKSFNHRIAAAACFIILLFGFYNLTLLNNRKNILNKGTLISFETIEAKHRKAMDYLDENINSENESINAVLEDNADYQIVSADDISILDSLENLEIPAYEENLPEDTVCYNFLNTSFDDFMNFEIDGEDKLIYD